MVTGQVGQGEWLGGQGVPGGPGGSGGPGGPGGSGDPDDPGGPCGQDDQPRLYAFRKYLVFMV